MKPRLYQRVKKNDPIYKHYQWHDETNNCVYQVRIRADFAQSSSMCIETRHAGGRMYTESEVFMLVEATRYKKEYMGIDFIKVLADAIDNES